MVGWGKAHYLPEGALMSGPLVAGIVVRSFQVTGAEVTDILVDDVCAVTAARLNEFALSDVVAVANLYNLVRMVNR
jgi:uncharacterized protein (UPF0261 family)